MAGGSSATSVSGSTRAGVGILSGFVANIAMMFSIFVLTSLGLLQLSWLPMIGSIFGASGASQELALSGLAWFVLVGMIAGLIFAFAWKRPTLVEGIMVGELGLLVLGIVLSVVSVPQLSGTILSMSLGDSLALIVPLAVCFAVWGLTAGFVGKECMK